MGIHAEAEDVCRAAGIRSDAFAGELASAMMATGDPSRPRPPTRDEWKRIARLAWDTLNDGKEAFHCISWAIGEVLAAPKATP